MYKKNVIGAEALVEWRHRISTIFSIAPLNEIAYMHM